MLSFGLSSLVAEIVLNTLVTAYVIYVYGKTVNQGKNDDVRTAVV